jgi:hypothetical protein
MKFIRSGDMKVVNSTIWLRQRSDLDSSIRIRDVITNEGHWELKMDYSSKSFGTVSTIVNCRVTIWVKFEFNTWTLYEMFVSGFIILKKHENGCRNGYSVIALILSTIESNFGSLCVIRESVHHKSDEMATLILSSCSFHYVLVQLRSHLASSTVIMMAKQWSRTFYAHTSGFIETSSDEILRIYDYSRFISITAAKKTNYMFLDSKECQILFLGNACKSEIIKWWICDRDSIALHDMRWSFQTSEINRRSKRHFNAHRMDVQLNHIFCQ